MALPRRDGRGRDAGAPRGGRGIRPAAAAVLAAALLALAGGCAGSGRSAGPPPAGPPELDVIFVASDLQVVTAMLDAAQVGPGDVVYDLGCGDGRIVIAAASRYGARGVGVDLDPERIREARANAVRAGVADRVTFLQQDLFATDVSGATVVALYLLPDLNLRLRPKLLRELRPGSRVVSHQFDMGDWRPERTIEVRLETLRHVFLWRIPPPDAPRPR
jgi:SAM-dependent methyltransferase